MLVAFKTGKELSGHGSVINTCTTLIVGNRFSSRGGSGSGARVVHTNY